MKLLLTHTPGPWRVTHHARCLKVESASRVICDGFRNEAANAHLIAAAPDLLAALKAVVAGHPLDQEIRLVALAAIAKAETQNT